MIEGELEFLVGKRTISAGAGSVVHGPRVVAHGYRNAGSAPSTIAVVIAPAGFEKFFEEAGEPLEDPSSLPEGPPDVEKLVAVA